MSESRRTFLKKAGIGSAAAAMFTNFGSGLHEAVQKQSLMSAPSELKITKVSAAYCQQSQRRMFVKIETNQGITAYGEGTDAVVGGYYLAKELGAQITGKNPLDVNRLFEELRKVNSANVFSGAQAGTFVGILSAIDAALWDLTGKALGQPLYRLLGGKFRDSVQLYTHPLSNRGTPEQIAASCAEAKKLGYEAIKVILDYSIYRETGLKSDDYNNTANNKEIDYIIRIVSTVRDAIGPDMGLMAELHTRYDVPTSIRLLNKLEPFNLTWIEEPVPAENMDALREITQSTNIPICVGENLFLGYQFQELLEKRAADIIMPDLQKCGGLGEGQRIANIANLHYVPFAPHCVCSPYGMMGSAHVCASVPNFYMMEAYQDFISTTWEGILKEKPVYEKGHMKLSEKPGIGLDLIEDGIRKYATPGIPFFE
ncbi:MAG TPA: mandelate racemase/muconate lactonizing enzyme family protein [Bacteroidales bacterium]|nr:mandelate racemase/muconate lactonizing enzyme family protein [Bacteroidales bacterium]